MLWRTQGVRLLFAGSSACGLVGACMQPANGDGLQASQGDAIGAISSPQQAYGCISSPPGAPPPPPIPAAGRTEGIGGCVCDEYQS